MRKLKPGIYHIVPERKLEGIQKSNDKPPGLIWLRLIILVLLIIIFMHEKQEIFHYLGIFFRTLSNICFKLEEKMGENPLW